MMSISLTAFFAAQPRMENVCGAGTPAAALKAWSTSLKESSSPARSRNWWLYFFGSCRAMAATSPMSLVETTCSFLSFLSVCHQIAPKTLPIMPGTKFSMNATGRRTLNEEEPRGWGGGSANAQGDEGAATTHVHPILSPAFSFK